MAGLPRIVKDHLEQAKGACLSAVETYNRPGVAFRTRTFTVLMAIAWTSLFHAIFYRRGRKPWYVRSGSGRGIRYEKVDGEPKHWELSECVRQFYGDQNPPQRKNLEFMVLLRNKIEHRYHPELDPVLYGECQALLMNFEELLVDQFGAAQALAEHLDLALQFSAFRPKGQKEALRRLSSSAAKDLLAFIQSYRAGLPADVLESSSYSVRVFLLPKLAARDNAADLAVEFVPYDPTNPEEMKRLRRVIAMIKEKRTPVASAGLIKPSEVVRRLRRQLSVNVTMHTHTQAWKAYNVRPPTGADNPAATRSEFCIYDELYQSYGYKEAWVKFVVRKLGDKAEFDRVLSWKPSQAKPDRP